MKKIYIAHCIEHREKFIFIFKTSETKPEKLLSMAQDEAEGWGAECYDVTLAGAEYKDREDIWDADVED